MIPGRETLSRQLGRGPRAQDLLREARRSIPGPDAEFLLMTLLRVRRHELYGSRIVDTSAARRFRRLVVRARSGEPVQYLVRSAPFLDLDLFVDLRVLIPRPETEELAVRALQRVRPQRRMLVLDYGTGSGCIAIAIARRLPGARVIAVDSSRAALNVARMNVRRYRLLRRIRFLLAQDIGQPALARLRGKLTLLISNPPYVPTGRMPRLPVIVREHEPRKGLDGGPKGTNIVAMLLEKGPELLAPAGLLAVEIDHTQAPFARRVAPLAEIERDFAGRYRYVFLRDSR